MVWEMSCVCHVYIIIISKSCEGDLFILKRKKVRVFGEVINKRAIK